MRGLIIKPSIAGRVFAHLFLASALPSIFIYRVPFKQIFSEFKTHTNKKCRLMRLRS